MARKVYSDACGGSFNVNVKRAPSLDSKCEISRTVGHKAYKVSVSEGKRTLWAPKHPMCVSNYERRRRGSGSALAEQAMGFFENNRCMYGKVKAGPLKPTGEFDGARRKKR